MMDKETKKKLVIGGIIALVVIAVVIIAIVVPKGKKEEQANEENEGEKESFFNAPVGAFVDPNTNVIRGNGILTDQMVFNRSAETLLDDVKKDAYYADEGNLGAAYNLSNFNKLYENQRNILKIKDRTENQVMSEEDMKSVTKKIQSSMNNGRYNLFDRGGSKNVKFSVEPNGTRAVIDGDYLGARDKNHQIAAVKRVIPVKGFDMDVERIPEVMSRHMSSKINSNKAANVDNNARKPAEAAMKAVTNAFNKIKDMSKASDEEVMENYERTRTSAGFIVDGYAK